MMIGGRGEVVPGAEEPRCEGDDRVGIGEGGPPAALGGCDVGTIIGKFS